VDWCGSSGSVVGWLVEVKWIGISGFCFCLMEAGVVCGVVWCHWCVDGQTDV